MHVGCVTNATKLQIQEERGDTCAPREKPSAKALIHGMRAPLFASMDTSARPAA